MSPFLILVLTGLFQEPADKDQGIKDPLAALNLHFRADYAKARAKLLAEGGPVITVAGDSMILRDQGKKQEAVIINDRYSRLKAISHIPLHIFVLMRDQPEGLITEARKERLVQLRSQWQAISKQLPGLGFEGKTLERNVEVIEKAIAISGPWVEGKGFDPQALRDYCLSQRAAIDGNTLEAARAQIETMDGKIQEWRKDLGPRWDQIRVVVRGMQMPRKDNLAVSYFAKLLGEKGESNRIVYAEGLADEGAGLSLLGTRLLDTEIGEVFFADRWRMHRDLLGDAAKEILSK